MVHLNAVQYTHWIDMQLRGRTSSPTPVLPDPLPALWRIFRNLRCRVKWKNGQSLAGVFLAVVATFQVFLP